MPVVPVEAYSKEDQLALLAYRDPLRALRKLSLCRPDASYNGASIKYTGETFKVAQQWVNEHRTGKLKEVPPNDYLDASNIGVKDHVLNAKRLLGDALVRLSIDWTGRKKPDTAAEAAVLALEIGQINKYADFPSLMASFGSQYRAVKQLEQIAANLSPHTTRRMRDRLKALKFKPVGELLERCEILYAQHSANLPDPITRSDIALINSAKSIVDSGKPNRLGVETIRDLVRNGSGDVPILICAARIGWEREAMILDHIARVQEKLGSGTKN